MGSEFKYSLGRCQAPRIAQLMGQLPLIVSYVLILLKAYSILSFQTHTHANIHLGNKHDISSQTLTYIYHASHVTSQHTSINIASITSKADICIYQIKAKTQAWQDQNNMFTYSQQTQIAHLIHIISSYPQLDACSCECMTYLTPPQHLCMDAWSYECVFMAKQRKTH